MYLIVGLGNPGEQYAHTRHNVGFIAAAMLAEKHNIPLKKRQNKALCGQGKICGKDVWIALPLTYMNESGISVKALMSNLRIPPENLIVIYDDMDIERGSLRIRLNGSAGSHNGMKSIIYQIETDQFKRIRIGIGRPEGHNSIEHVLGEFSTEEQNIIKEACENAVAAIECGLTRGFEIAMNRYNKTQKPAQQL